MARRSWILSAVALALLFFTLPALAQEPFTVGTVTAHPGTLASGAIDIPARGDDGGTTIPISIVHGRAPGPVLALIAGTHGMEYVPILGLQRLRGTLDPVTLRGTIIMVHVANMPSFLGRTVYYSPADGQNLNRVYPGKADGTLSERIAHAITTQVIERATHVVDLHCGDGNESLRPYTYWITTGDPQVAEEGRAMALAFGLPHIVVDGARPTDPAASIYTSNTAITRGKPALTTETGALAQVDEESIGLMLRGIAGLLRHLKMQEDGPPPLTTPVMLRQSEVLRAGATGIFYPAIERGHTVAKGGLIGRITDFHGRLLEEIVAPFDGEILYVIGTPPMSSGEPVAMIGAR
jgi:predicted deacylase